MKLNKREEMGTKTEAMGKHSQQKIHMSFSFN